MPQSIALKIPDKYPLTPELVKHFGILNADLLFNALPGNILNITENAFNFDDYEFVELYFPVTIFDNGNFDELYELNPKEINFEQPGNHSIRLKMGTFTIIGLITSGIIISLGIWISKNKRGNIYPENTEYHLKNDLTNETEKYMADVSYISFDKVSEKEQLASKKGLKTAPTLSIEVVSSKYGLKPALKKMKDVWMKHGTDIGVVVCPFSKQLYIFEKNKSGYREQSIYIPFTHPLLPDYEGDFGKYADEI